MGEVSLGMARSGVLSAYGAPGAVRREKGSQLVDAVYHRHGGLLVVTYRGERVVGIATTSEYYSTMAGLTVGSGAARVSGNQWIKCLHIYRGRSHGATVEYLVKGKRSPRIAQISMLRGQPRTCKQ
jgi:hypothetical protein